MKKIEIKVMQGNRIIKKFHIEEGPFNTANGQTRTGLHFDLETVSDNATKGSSKGYIDGTTIYNLEDKSYGTFTRPPRELATGDNFQVNFSASGVYECECTDVREVAPPPVNTPAPPKQQPRGVKTREEIEWELEQMKHIPIP